MQANPLNQPITNLNIGHRKRLKDKFLKVPIRTFYDYEVLEMLLYNCYPRCDTKPIAKNLLSTFGSLKELLSADQLQLREKGGVNDSVIFQLKLLQDLISRLHLPVEENIPILCNWNAVLSYCNLTMSLQNYESFRILYLNKKNVLIQDEIMQTGTVDSIAVYPREIAKRCLINSASAIILVHNHPSGEASPSKEDIEITYKIIKALEVISVAVHDHLIITKMKVFSFKNSSLI